MIDISFLLLRSAFTTSFTLIESVGKWVNGKWVVSQGQERILYGAVSPTSQKDLERLPETSRLECTTTFWVKGATHLNIDASHPPRIRYRGATYTITQEEDYSNHGFTKLYGKKLGGI